jgi:hypothetical protein
MTIQIKLSPTLVQCIETVAKREYWKSVGEYLREKKEDRYLEEKIELLRSFLETADFRALRAQSEQCMIDGMQVQFTIFMKDGKPLHEMSVEKIT